MTYEEAVDAMLTALTAKWALVTAEVFPSQLSVPELRYEGKEARANPPLSVYWARASYESVTRRKASLTTSPNALYMNVGIVYFDIYCPEMMPTAAQTGRQLARKMVTVFNVQADGVWFARPTIREFNPDRGWYRFGLQAEYRFPERS